MVVNGAQLASYSQAKEVIVQNGYLDEGIRLHFCASMISGLLTTIASMPVDIVKTRVQKSSGHTNPIVNTYFLDALVFKHCVNFIYCVHLRIFSWT